MSKFVVFIWIAILSIFTSVGQKIERERLIPEGKLLIDVRDEYTILILDVPIPWHNFDVASNLESPFAIIKPRVSSIFEKLLPEKVMSSSWLSAFAGSIKFVRSNNVWKIDTVVKIIITYNENVMDENGEWIEKRVRLRDPEILDRIKKEIQKCEAYIYEPEAMPKSDLLWGAVIYYNPSTHDKIHRRFRK